MVEKSQAHARPCLPKGLRLAAAEPLLSPTLPVGLRNLFHVLACSSVRANNAAYAKSFFKIKMVLSESGPWVSHRPHETSYAALLRKGFRHALAKQPGGARW